MREVIKETMDTYTSMGKRVYQLLDSNIKEDIQQLEPSRDTLYNTVDYIIC